MNLNLTIFTLFFVFLLATSAPVTEFRFPTLLMASASPPSSSVKAELQHEDGCPPPPSDLVVTGAGMDTKTKASISRSVLAWIIFVSCLILVVAVIWLSRSRRYATIVYWILFLVNLAAPILTILTHGFIPPFQLPLENFRLPRVADIEVGEVEGEDEGEGGEGWEDGEGGEGGEDGEDGEGGEGEGGGGDEGEGGQNVHRPHLPSIRVGQTAESTAPPIPISANHSWIFIPRDARKCDTCRRTPASMLGPYHCESCGIGSLRIDANAAEIITRFML